MRLLIDHSVLTHSEFAIPAVAQQPVEWGGRTQAVTIHGLQRAEPSPNPDYQHQIDALFTVGRLMRAGLVQPMDYSDLQWERMQDRMKMPACNALRHVEFGHCPPPIERSRFRKTKDFFDYVSKGGKKDREAGRPRSEFSRVSFLEWLCSLSAAEVGCILGVADQLGLTEFERESFRQLPWFQFLCKRSESPENYPDVFHLWTAQRNGLDGFLTLERRLPNLVSRVRLEKVKRIAITITVYRPLDLLSALGVSDIDPVPMQSGRFYHYHEASW